MLLSVFLACLVFFWVRSSFAKCRRKQSWVCGDVGHLSPRLQWLYSGFGYCVWDGWYNRDCTSRRWSRNEQPHLHHDVCQHGKVHIGVRHNPERRPGRQHGRSCHVHRNATESLQNDGECRCSNRFDLHRDQQRRFPRCWPELFGCHYRDVYPGQLVSITIGDRWRHLCFGQCL